MSNTLQLIFQEALTEFKGKNGDFPKKIIIYRDGVGASQQSAVMTHELPQLKQALKNLDGNAGDDIKMMVVLVNKRVAQRFFNNQNPQRMCNPVPGTVINSGVVEANTYDFYLVSQTSR